jgi:hypothetical protein
VSCFAPLKQAYKKELRGLADSHIHHIDKKAFLATFKPIFDKAFLKNNILSSFRATGLVPHNPIYLPGVAWCFGLPRGRP